VPTARELELQAAAQARQQRQQFGNQQSLANPPNLGFTPYQPPPIPSGYFDPALDAQRQAASRGLLNTEQDVGLAGRRAQEDLGYETGQINTGYDRGIQDTEFQRSYANADYTQQHDWNQQDYDRNVGLLTRQYTQQGRQQAEQARKYGVTSGGIALLSAAKRAENQSIDRSGIDTSYQRAQSGLTTAHDRTLQGLDTAQSRMGEDKTTALSRAGTLYDRGVGDRGTVLGRARGEDTFYGLDVGAQKQYQAQQAGYDAPTGPTNQFTRPDGSVVQIVIRNGERLEVDPSGRILSRRKA
jgi:hypothetical protein